MPDTEYEVVWPLGKRAYQTFPSRCGVADLNNKTICELWDWLFRGEEIFPLIRESLQKRYPGVKFVDYNKFGNTRGPQEPDVIAELPDLLAKYGCDAVISGIGA